MVTVIHESLQELLWNRPQFEEVKTRIEDIDGVSYRIGTAPCGCTFRTRIVVRGIERGLSWDGRTDLCEDHAILEESDK